jgi:poly-gamma-glutamate synthesis protein (capsule biosynthesis protein)
LESKSIFAVCAVGTLLVAIPTALLNADRFFTEGLRNLRQPAANDGKRNGVNLLFVGDIMLSRNVAGHVLEKADGDFRFPFLQTAELTQQADIAFANLECPISGRGQAIDKKYVFNAPADAVQGLVFAGFDVVSLANNHILDYGAAGLNDTLRLLAAANINYIGLSTNGGTGQKPFIVEKGGTRIGFLAYADPFSPFSYPAEFKRFSYRPAEARSAIIASDIDSLRANADVIVISVHWGIEYELEPSAQQCALAHFIIDRGADFVVGHHPHVLQSTEDYGGGHIFYSLGNFIFDQHSRPETRNSTCIQVRIENEMSSAKEIALFINDDWQPQSVEQVTTRSK